VVLCIFLSLKMERRPSQKESKQNVILMNIILNFRETPGEYSLLYISTTKNVRGSDAGNGEGK
jgi:hypothetical protein